MKHLVQVTVIIAFLALTLTGGLNISRLQSPFKAKQTVRTVGQVKQASQYITHQHQLFGKWNLLTMPGNSHH